MAGFTTNFQIIPADAILTSGVSVPPRDGQDILSVLPGTFSISADTATLLARLTPTSSPLRLAA